MKTIDADRPLPGVAEIFGPDGLLGPLLSGYERRPEQAALASEVELALARGEVGFFEAGTGTGKSLAYLVPAAAHAMRAGKPVVVSTYTIALQEQLLTREIPVVERLFPGLRAVLVKGWRNYLCRLRLDAAVREGDDLFDSGRSEALRAVALWAESTQDGTLSDLPFEPDPDVWDEVAAESDSCLRAECPHYRDCPLFRDRAAMADAHLLVVNHHLLFADVAIRRQLGWETDQAILPRYAAVILDEAHHVEDVATEHLGAALSSLGVAQLFGRIHRRRGGAGRGLVARIFRRPNLEEQDFEAVDSLIPGVYEAEERVQSLLELAVQIAEEHGMEDQGQRRRIGAGIADDWEHRLAPALDEAVESIRRLAKEIERLAERLFPPGELEGADLTLRAQMEAAARRLGALAVTLAHFTSLDTRANVYWIEAAPAAWPQVRLQSAPLDVGEAIREWVGAECPALILVSATLSVRGSFAYVRERLGLAGQDEVAGGLGVREALIESAFDYGSQALLGIVEDLPEPTDRGYGLALARALAALVEASRGRALLLFTSFQLLDEVRSALDAAPSSMGIRYLAQGSAPRSRLLDEFRRRPEAVLLGVDSFWEGVDVPGEALSLVVLTRLPFDVPTDPLTRARAERIEQAGGSSFAEYTLPRAALRLKQGFGRLIRSRSDRGAVVICDRRIKDRSYGRTLLESLPRALRRDGPFLEVARAVRAFLEPPSV